MTNLSPPAQWLAASLAQDAQRRAWVGKAVGIPGASFYAQLPLAAIVVDNRWWVAAPTNPPPTAHPQDIAAWDPDDGDVLLWDPVTNEARIWGDDTPAIFRGDPHHDRLVIYTSPRAFLAAWVKARAEHAAQVAQLTKQERESLHEPQDGYMPGALVVGAISKVRWHHMPRQVIAPDKNAARAIQRAIDRDTHSPSVTTGNDDAA